MRMNIKKNLVLSRNIIISKYIILTLAGNLSNGSAEILFVLLINCNSDMFCAVLVDMMIGLFLISSSNICTHFLRSALVLIYVVL